MMQQNCKPCQGIQSITPRPLLNLIGQQQLNYRVGDYAAFYETMLAALSRNTLPTELTQNVESVGLQSNDLSQHQAQQPSPLRYLTARDKDDPSIAMLDAWAVLADLLTFYNERYLNEAYLGTATQSQSLFELANMVGYAPRPGLSSSVHLAFEVDDRGEEVLIPAGTPAKSTPIPGSGQIPETFETSQPIKGRPSFNKIRPRLTRPQDLSPSNLRNLDRIYLKGTGLRIQPTDYIAIGARDVPGPDFRKVIEVEERRESVQGPVTILRLEEDELSVPKLVREATTACRSFFEYRDTPDVVDPTELKTLAEALIRKIEQAGLSGYKEGIAAADESIAKEVLSGELLDPQGATRKLIDTIDRLLTARKTWPSGNKTLDEQITDQYRIDIDGFKANITNLYNAFQVERSVIEKTIDFGNANSIVDYENGLYGLHPFSSLVHIAHAIPNRHFAAALTNIEFGPFVPQAMQTFSIAFLTDGPAIAPLNNAAWSAITAKVKAASVAGCSVVHFIVTDNSSRFITAGVVSAQGSSIVTPERISFANSGNGVPIAPDFEYADTSGAIDFSFAAKSLEGTSTLSLATAADGEIASVVTAIKSSTVDVVGDRATILITIKKGTSIHAMFLRTVLVDSHPCFFRSIGAEYLSGTRSQSDVRQWLNVAETSLSDCRSAALDNVTSAEGFLNRLSFLLDDAYPLPLREILRRLKQSIINIAPTMPGTVSFPVFEPIRQSLSRLQLLDPTTSAVAIDAAIKDLHNSCDLCAQRAGLFVDRYILFINSMRGCLARRRAIIVNNYEASYLNILSSLSDIQPQEIFAKQLLIQTFSESQPTSVSLKSRLVAFQKPLDLNSSVADLDAMLCTLKELKERAEFVIARLLSFAPLCSDKGRIALTTTCEIWKRTGDAVKLRTDNPASKPPVSVGKLSDMIADFLKSAGIRSAGSSVSDVTSVDSSTWIQVLNALNQSEKQQLLQFFDQMRRIGTATEGNLGVWVIRSTANLFGWNSHAAAGSVSVRAGLTTTTNPVGINDDPLDFPSANKLLDDRIYVDGKLSKTLAESPIGIRLGTDSEIKGLWVTSVAVQPHSAYGLSNESTVLQFVADAGWFGGVQKFQLIRSAKVFCDSERVDLSEAFLSDSPSDKFIATSVLNPAIQLQGFHAYLGPGRAILTGVTSKPSSLSIAASKPPIGASRVSELIDIVQVRHLPPLIHGEGIRTELRLAAPLGNIYWRDTVEICANVVEATHGETVSEVLGSGDARKPFQKFPLRRAPLTRLSAPVNDGKQDQLEITVHNTRWGKVAHLVHSGAADEVYELSGNRNNANSTIQFGSGINGARLPTGVENVKALYRVGLGVGGNVEPGQINQLPSPPFGVKGVTNPLRGDGGADADSIAQTRLRIPALASGMRTLVSLDDYKNFALLFAGIDKVSVESRSGQITMYVAGCAPDPLDKQGSLLRNLVSAFEQLGDDGALVQVEPHQGLLLHIDASVSIDARHDWEPVKAAIEKALLVRFGYPHAQLGVSIAAADVVKTIQSVDKVNYVVLNRLLGMMGSSNRSNDDTRRSFSDDDSQTTARVNDHVNVRVDEVCYIHEEVSSTVQLRRLP